MFACGDSCLRRRDRDKVACSALTLAHQNENLLCSNILSLASSATLTCSTCHRPMFATLSPQTMCSTVGRCGTSCLNRIRWLARLARCTLLVAFQRTHELCVGPGIRRDTQVVVTPHGCTPQGRSLAELAADSAYPSLLRSSASSAVP